MSTEKTCGACKYKNISEHIEPRCVCENGSKYDAAEINDPVNHPTHYTHSGMECIDVMLATQGIEAVKSFCLCNAFKYLYRHNGKNGVEDIKKAQWYINKFIELEEEK